MALVSPGLQVSIIDESQYLTTAVGTVPFVLLATAENKIINNTVASGTLKINAGKMYGISSQRELAATFGAPVFKTSAAGTPLHGGETNEYGLMAAYSALSLGNRVWVIRADIDLDQLAGTTTRPVGTVANGVNWLDYSASDFGIFEYDQVAQAFVKKYPLLVTDTANLTTSSTIPISAYGTIGSYAVVITDNNNYVYVKGTNNIWTQLGSNTWAYSLPVVTSTTSVANIAVNSAFTINGTVVTALNTITTVPSLVTLINTAVASAAGNAAIKGITAVTTSAGRLAIKITGPEAGGECTILDGLNTPMASIGIVSTPAKTYSPATVGYGAYTAVPAWGQYDTTPRPSGSVWIKTSVQGAGANIVVKRYNAALDQWNTLAVPLYADGYAALYGLDSTGGGSNIAVGTVFAQYNVAGNVGYKIYSLPATGTTSVTGTIASPTFVTGSTFNVNVSMPGTATPGSYTCTISGTTAAAFVAAVLAANIPNVTASGAGPITLTHTADGIMTLVNTSTGTNPIDLAGFTSATPGVLANIVSGAINLTNWVAATYTYSSQAPNTVPADGTLWYDSDPLDVDVMVCDSLSWKGYKNVTRDSRGFALTATDAAGVIAAASAPITQSNGSSALVPGDLWLDTGDLENYPALYRRSATSTWAMIDKTDKTSQNGIVFADARWGGSGTVDPVNDAYPTVASLLTSDYTDLDAPDYRLYPRGTLLFNTRRSGFSVKTYQSNYFHSSAFPGKVLPSEKGTWVTEITLKSDGTPNMGHYAQRAHIVMALKAAVDSNTDIRNDAYAFNLLAAPGYPELLSNLVSLNNDRSNTGFIISDTPMNLAPDTNSLNAFNATVTVASEYSGIYYPSGLSTDTTGRSIAVPASHMMLRTIMHSDSLSYQWFAPAGTRRGLVDNVTAIGYVDFDSGVFISTPVGQQTRDTLYELSINPIAVLPGVGIAAYGQKTRNYGVLAQANSAMDRINVARLVNYLRTAFTSVTNQFLFEPNDKIVRDQVKTVVESLLNDLVTKRGLYDYLVVCDLSNNTPDRIARNELYIDIAVSPVKDVEFIYIPIRLVNPGVLSAA